MLQNLLPRTLPSPNSADAALSHLYPSLFPFLTSSLLLASAPGACTASAGASSSVSCLRHSPPLQWRACGIRELVDRRRSGALWPGTSAAVDQSGRISFWKRRSEAAGFRRDPGAARTCLYLTSFRSVSVYRKSVYCCRFDRGLHCVLL
jgi:hypothetical protein